PQARLAFFQRRKIGKTTQVDLSFSALMHEELWAGVELKFQHAEFHLERMSRSLDPPEPTATNVAQQAAGTIIGTWERAFYAHFDAFLSSARSIPEIIQCCFGVDLGHPEMKRWFNSLPEPEKLRRHQFSEKFGASYKDFRKLPLSTVRNISVHR